MPQIHTSTTTTVVSYPVVRLQPSSVVVRVQVPGTAMPTSTTAATVNSVSTTLSSAASAGAMSVVVASNTNVIAGREYLITSTDTPTISVAVERIDSTTLRLKTPLPCAVPSGAAFVGYSVSTTVTTNDESGEGLIKWSATVSGVVYTWDQRLDVVYDQVAYNLTVPKLVAAFPVVHQLRNRRDLSVDQAIQASWDYQVLPDLRSRGIDPARINSWDYLDAVHARACVWHLVSSDPSADADFVTRLWEDYQRTFKTAIDSRGFWVQDDPKTEMQRPDGSTSQTLQNVIFR